MQNLSNIVASACALSALLFLGCGADSGESSSCVPNQAIPCACGEGKTGRQICNESGSAYSSCSQCGAPVLDSGMQPDSDAADSGVNEADVPGETIDSGSSAKDGAIEDSSTAPRLGGPCTPLAALACAGLHQKLTMLCGVSGVWEKNETCSGNQLCEDEPGPNAGTCQEPPKPCGDVKPGETSCLSDRQLGTCDPTTLTFKKIETCKYKCYKFRCGVCEDGAVGCGFGVHDLCINGVWVKGAGSC